MGTQAAVSAFAFRFGSRCCGCSVDSSGYFAAAGCYYVDPCFDLHDFEEGLGPGKSVSRAVKTYDGACGRVCVFAGFL